MSLSPVRTTQRRVFAFLVFLFFNPLFLCFWLQLPVPMGKWFVWSYHGVEILLVFAVLASKAAREIKVRASLMLLGILIGLGVEWRMFHHVVSVPRYQTQHLHT